MQIVAAVNHWLTLLAAIYFWQLNPKGTLHCILIFVHYAFLAPDDYDDDDAD